MSKPTTTDDNSNSGSSGGRSRTTTRGSSRLTIRTKEEAQVLILNYSQRADSRRATDIGSFREQSEQADRHQDDSNKRGGQDPIGAADKTIVEIRNGKINQIVRPIRKSTHTPHSIKAQEIVYATVPTIRENCPGIAVRS
jgi:hypothetical protein